MSDFLDRIITLVIILIMVIIGPLTFRYVSNESSAKRLIVNETEEFLDSIKDRGSVNEDSLDELYSTLNSHGMSLDVNVTKLKRVMSYDNANDKLTDSYLECDKSTAYDEMIQDKGTESAVDEYKLKYGIQNLSVDEAIKKLKSIKSKKYEYCLEKGDIVKVEIKEIAYSSTKRILHKVVGVSEDKLDIKLETVIK